MLKLYLTINVPYLAKESYDIFEKNCPILGQYVTFGVFGLHWTLYIAQLFSKLEIIKRSN